MPIIQFTRKEPLTNQASNVTDTKQETFESTNDSPVVDRNEHLENITGKNSVAEKPAEDTGPKTVNIVIDGPLGHTYTRALQIMFANEAYDVTVNDVVNENERSVADVYLYACADKVLDDSGNPVDETEKIRLALDSSKAKVKYLAMEHGGVLTARKVLCLDYLKSCGVSITDGREMALNRAVRSI
jgi:hypothetical protein